MANQMFVQKIHRLTLVRKGRAKAKHPDMQTGVLEVVKASPATESAVLLPTGQASTPSLDRFRRGWQ